jgi:CHAD domain-containing protein
MPPPTPASHSDRASPLLRQRIRGVFRHLPKGLAGNEESLHQMRVAGRRLRVALPLLARKPEGRRVRRALRILRQLTRTAGASRDLDVSADLFQGRLRALGSQSAEQSLLLRRLRAARGRSRTRMAEALMDLEIARLRQDLRTIVSWRAQDVFTVLSRLREARDTLGQALLSGFQELGDRLDPVGLHRLRRRARRLRYVAEVSDLLRGEESQAPALWKSLQDEIGSIHDHHVLAAWLEGQANSATARGQEALAALARAEQAAVLEAGSALHRALLERGPAEVAARALAAMGWARMAASPMLAG